MRSQLKENLWGHYTLVAGTWTETKKCITVDFFLKLADDDVLIKNPKDQNREVRGF